MPDKTQEATARIRPALVLLLSLALLAILALSVSCAGQSLTYIDVTPEEAYEMISQQEVAVLDVRTPEEYKSGHILDAIFIPLSQLESRLYKLNSSDDIIVYSGTSQSSEEAASTLVANGFTHVYNMNGGIEQWQHEGFPIKEEKCMWENPSASGGSGCG